MALPQPGEPDRFDAIGRTVTAVAMILAGTVMLFTKTGEVGTNYTLITGAFAVMGVQVRRG